MIIYVSMKSGLEDRDNSGAGVHAAVTGAVSMKSGLEDRNNPSSSNQFRQASVSQ